MFFVLEFCILLVILKIFAKLTTGFCKSNTCLTGKTAIVTGGSEGLGYETALALASRGCRVIVASRSSDEKIKQDLIKKTNNPNIITKNLDLSSFESVRQFAAEINETEERLDILINNAGIGRSTTGNTEDDVNHMMQVNHFGPFLLTHRLSDLLKKSAPSRIIFVSSILAFCHNFNSLDELANPCKPDEIVNSVLKSTYIYSNSKLCNVIASQGFAKRLEKFGVTSNSLHPGFVKTDIFRKTLISKKEIFTKLLYLIPGFLFKSVYEGAQTIIHLAVSNDVKDVTGKFFADCVPCVKPRATYNEELCQKVWEFSNYVVNVDSHQEASLSIM